MRQWGWYVNGSNPKTFAEFLGREVWRARRKVRVGQFGRAPESQEMAELAKLSQSAYSRIERGQVSMKVEGLVKLCEALGVDPCELLRRAIDAQMGGESDKD